MSSPQFSATAVEAPIRVAADGAVVMPEWSDSDPQPPTAPPKEPSPSKRVARDLQPDATQMDSVVQAKEWLDAHPEEAEMLRAAQAKSGDILADAGVGRWYSSTEAAAFFDKTVQWLYWGMRHPPNGGRLFVRPVTRPDGTQVTELDASGRAVPVIEDIPVPRLGDPARGKRRFDIPTIREFAKSAYHRGNIKEPKLTAVLQRLVVAEHGGNWKAIPIPQRREDGEDADGQ